MENSFDALEKVLTEHVAESTLDMFLLTRVDAEEAAAAVASLARDVARKHLRALSLPPATSLSVLQLRDVADAAWESLGHDEPAVASAPLDAAALETAVKKLSRDQIEQRKEALVAALGEQAQQAARGALQACDKKVLGASKKTRVRAAALRLLAPVHELAWTRDPALQRAHEACKRDVLARAQRAPLTSQDVRSIEKTLRMGSITQTLAMCALVLLRKSKGGGGGEKEEEGEGEREGEGESDSCGEEESEGEEAAASPCLPRFLGVPAMMREARAFAFSADSDDSTEKRPNPALAAPKGAGGALPPPDSFLVCVGSGDSGALTWGSKVLAKGGGLLVCLPGWRGLTHKGKEERYAHYLRVDPQTRFAALLRVTASASSSFQPEGARVLLRFRLGVSDDDPEKAVGWVDAQRDFEGNLVLAWGSFNAFTGGVARSYYMGLVEADDYAATPDPFHELKKEDVDDMFAARLETGSAIDFRDHGNIVEASVESGTTTVVYHDTVVKVLKGIELVAVWGTAHAFGGWARSSDGTLRAHTWRGATRATEVQETIRDDALPLFLLPPSLSLPSLPVSVAPWWA